MKNKNLLKVLGISLLVVMILSWIIPATLYDSTTNTLTLSTITPTGFANIFASLDVIAVYFAQPTLLILMIGMLYGVMNKTGLYKALVDKISSIFKKEAWLFVIITALFYGVTTASTGIYLQMLIFVPLSIAILLELKYTKLQSLLLTVGSVIVGIGAEFSSAIFAGVTGAETNTYLWIKVGLFVVLIALILLYVLLVKNSKSKKAKSEEETIEDSMFVPEKRDAINSKTPKWIPVLIVLALMYVVLVLGLKAWTDNSAFSTFYDKIKDIKIGSFAVFSSILGSFETFGEWTYGSVYATIGAAILAISIIGKLKFKEIVNASIEGAKKLLGPAIFAALLYLILIFTLDSKFLMTIIKFIVQSGNVALVTLGSFISTPFMAEEYYASSYILKAIYIITTNESLLELYGLIVQVLYGFAMLVAPSSVLLMVSLYYTGESYTKWVKYIWKLLLVMLVACLIAITIATLI